MPVSGVTRSSTPCRPASNMVSAYFSTVSRFFMKTGVICAAATLRGRLLDMVRHDYSSSPVMSKGGHVHIRFRSP